MELPKYKKVNAIPAGVDNTILFLAGTNPNEVTVHYEDQGEVYPIQGDYNLNELSNTKHVMHQCQSLASWNILKAHVTGNCLVWIKAVGGVGRLYFYNKAADQLSQLKESVS